ncbi:hypothetical protein HG263_19155 [Pseudoalteromonas sp. JBTF-M23]|uniref:Uncharacterized protein n=1 Tax=Pseudoalteromonas caenipelagi TaxID=2726988 RepID=A0A849VH69_9GAMM|nr:hypothetical protein [Pseudoalteromonas caenipelagi]NOU52626.1 hypothetical protein [Pseudoalteromonas caenipelagi]
MTELSAIERGKKALREMQAEGVRITKNAVVTRARFDHTNFNKKDYENTNSNSAS